MGRRSLAGARGIVTGASSGIGRALALELAGRGAKIVATARQLDKLNELVGAAAKSFPQSALEIVAGDITESGVRGAVVERACQVFGGVDFLVNNAGVSALGRFEEASSERMRRIMEVNFFAAVEMLRAALPSLRQGNSPILVNIGSILGHRGIPHNSEYCASKFALRGFTESIRPELAQAGIDVLLVSPGTTNTDFFSHLLEPGATPWPQQPGVTPQVVARRTAQAMERGRREITVNWRGTALVWLNRLFPRLVDRLMNRYG